MSQGWRERRESSAVTLRSECQQAAVRGGTAVIAIYTYLLTLILCGYIPYIHFMPVRLPKELRPLAKKGVFRARDVAPFGIHRYRLKELVEGGVLRRTGRGLYMSRSTDITEHHSLVQLAVQCPKAVMCLLTALRFHDLTTENPEVVYVLLPKGVKRPRITNPRLEVTWASGASCTEGIEAHVFGGVTVQVTSPAKTVADCFKYRGKVGIPLAAEALRDAWQKKKASSAELWHAAKVCRMTNIMRPYFEMLV